MARPRDRAWGETYDPLLTTSPARPPSLPMSCTSTIPIPDLSALTMAVPEMVIADAANDPASPPPPPARRRRIPFAAAAAGKRNHRATPTHDEAFALRVGELGAGMVSEGVTPIEEISTGSGEAPSEGRACVPGIDIQQRRPSIGRTRPLHEDKQMCAEGWAVVGSPEASTRRTSSEQMESSKRKLVNFTPYTTTPITRYYNPRKESDFSVASSISGRDGSITSTDYPFLCSPHDSPPLDACAYKGTILDLVSDPQEIREYRNLERWKEIKDRRASGSTSAASGGGRSWEGSRSGSINLGRRSSVEQGMTRKTSVGEHSMSGHPHTGRFYHAHSPRTTWTMLGDHPTFVDPTDIVPGSSPTTRRSLDIDTSLSALNGGGRSTSRQHSSRASPTSPSSSTTGQHLFHPDLHPVADHHIPPRGHMRNETTRDTLKDLNSIAHSDTALYVHQSPDPHSTGNRAADPSAATLAADPPETEETSPSSSSGTVRPPLLVVAGGGKPKAQTVADFRGANDDDDVLEAEE
ncbi:hypothetical protein NliqN6_5520 [Naganishia liquefaciens]|uniref:Uncharacterized protein n=1 Tax=Naganishia liquefaciens TaxID=104408 RepID=A0A8H3TYE4_9TREE|nr:hypothetical protein NliqN6_5520 [Naganishia liquefaciens]